jgi:hypothetical protein
MQKAFEKIKERLKEASYSAKILTAECKYVNLDRAVEIVNQVAEEYKDKLIKDIEFGIKASNADDTYTIGLRNGMRWCLSLLDGKEPIFEDCNSNDGWIPCSERLPSREEYQKCNGQFIVSDGNRTYATYFDIYDTLKFGEPTIERFRVDKCVIVWRELPQPYVKGE